MAATAAVAALLLTAGCGGQQNTGNLPEQNGSRTEYALTFFRNVSGMEGKDDNVLVSPYSAGMALSMLAEGAEGETRDEIVTALGGSTFAGDILAADSLVDVRSANSAWVRAGFGLRQEYVSRLEQAYGAMIAEKDFADRTTVGDINRWCSDNTEGRIDGIVEQIAPDMVMFLHRSRKVDADKLVKDQKGENTLQPTKVIVAKQRNGETGEFFVGFKPSTASFESLADGAWSV